MSTPISSFSQRALFEMVCPELYAAFRLDQLRGEAEPVSRFADTALKQIAHPQFAAHFKSSGRNPLEAECGIA